MIKPFCKEDLSSLPALQPDGWANNISHAFDYYLENPFCFPFKYVVDGNIAGTGCGINYGKTAWIAHIIVHKDYRRQGIGLKIVEHANKLLLHHGVETISLIATLMGEPVYRKAGFNICCEYSFYNGDNSTDFKISENIVPYNKKHYNELLEFDKKHTGENRNLILQDLHNTSLYIINNTIEGYYIPDLGQGHIIADNSTAGIELMKLRLRDNKDFVLPSDNDSGINFLEELGFSKSTTAKRMYYGKALNLNPQCIYNRIAGN